MIWLNTFSIIDFLSPAITGLVMGIFLYRYWRITRQDTDLLFIISIFFIFAWGLMVGCSDNVVPSGVPATAIPKAAERTLFLCRAQYCFGLLFLVSLTHFALRYCQSQHLRGWWFLWLYAGALLVMPLFWSESFIRAPETPLSETSNWKVVLPWQPTPGPLAPLFAVMIFVVSGYVQYLMWSRPRPKLARNHVSVRANSVWLGLTGFLIAGAVSVIEGAIGYAGVSFGSLCFALSMIVLGIGLAEEYSCSEREREHVTKRFQSYVDPSLVQYVLEHPDQRHFDGEVREMTVVFTDLDGFTTLSEKLREGVVPLLNEYLSMMSPLIREHNGYRNKFLGDGTMFFYGAPQRNPDHAIHAVWTVLKMREMMEQFNESLAARRLPTLSMRTGVSTGKMIVGDAGSEDASDYTVLGDAVNLGSRLESANKVTGTRILFSQRTADLLPPDFVLLRPIAKLQVVGLTRPVMTYEPLARFNQITDFQKKVAELTRSMVDCFLHGDFSGCLQAEERMTRELGPGKLGALYRELCKEYLLQPPGANFTGTIVLTSK